MSPSFFIKLTCLIKGPSLFFNIVPNLIGFYFIYTFRLSFLHIN